VTGDRGRELMLTHEPCSQVFPPQQFGLFVGVSAEQDFDSRVQCLSRPNHLPHTRGIGYCHDQQSGAGDMGLNEEDEAVQLEIRRSEPGRDRRRS
jgi:hypothetical protein